MSNTTYTITDADGRQWAVDRYLKSTTISYRSQSLPCQAYRAQCGDWLVWLLDYQPFSWKIRILGDCAHMAILSRDGKLICDTGNTCEMLTEAAKQLERRDKLLAAPRAVKKFILNPSIKYFKR